LLETAVNLPPAASITQQVRAALAEDIGSGDLTAALVPEKETAQASVVGREAAVVCGSAWVDEVFHQLDTAVAVDWQVRDGQDAPADTTWCTLTGPARALLSGERTALNFLQLLAATATRARAYTARLQGTGARLLDTRKTLPGLRLAQKYAVTCGGGYNHRLGLYDGILVKENHVRAAGSVSAAVGSALTQAGETTLVEIEVENLAELSEALAAGASRVLLDNFSLEQLREAVRLNAGRAELEASGNVTLETIRHIALTGVNFISTGEITKNVCAVDLSLQFES
jgi:nicotinate-nucleotide pyrophosphorylase (carboxylating)